MSDLTRAKLCRLTELVNELDDVRQKNTQVGRILASESVRASLSVDFNGGEHQRFKLDAEFTLAAVRLLQQQIEQRFGAIEAELGELGFVGDEAPAP